MLLASVTEEALRSALRGGVDRVCQLVQVGVEGGQETQDRMPADPSLAALDPRDVGQVDTHASRQLALRDPSAVAQPAERSSENDLISLSVGGIRGVVVHASLSPPRRVEDVFALLDLIGWPADGESREVEVDLRRYGWSLKEALDSFLPLIEDELEEADANDRYRASKGKPPRKAEITGRLAAFREFMPLVERRVKEIE